MRNGGISGDADFKAYFDDREENFEFQYSDRDDLDFFDFKVSKVGKKIKNKREPYKDKKFIYILKPSLQYCIIEPEWIMKNGEEAGVPAWGNRTAFRVPSDKFKEILNTDNNLKEVIKKIDIKINLLNFQFDFIKNEENKLSKILQSVIDEEKILKIIPKELNSFYQVCFLIDKLNKVPENCNLWLIYLLTFYNEKLTSYQIAQLLFCIDFLYSKTELKDNEITKIVEIIDSLKEYCDAHQTSNGRFETSMDLSPKEELRNFVFIINLLEDLIQDTIYYYNTNIKPINKIFENIKFIDEVEKNIQ